MINGVNVVGTVLVGAIVFVWFMLSIAIFVLFEDDNDDMEKRE